MRQATGVLLAWRRIGNLPPIISRMLQEQQIAEVVVWSNRSSYYTHQLRQNLQTQFPSDRLSVLGCGTNIYTLGRYLAVRAATSELIVTCDDDCLVDNWGELIAKHRKSRRLVCNIDEGHFDHARRSGFWVHKYAGGTAFEALVGWGACFHRDQTGVLDRYMRVYGADDLLRRKADRFFTILQDRSHVLLRKKVRHFPEATSPASLYRQPGHWKLTQQAQQRAIELLESRRVESCGAECS